MKTTKALFGILGITLALVVQVHAQTFLTNGLVAYYPFNGNANDASGSGHNGTVYGATLTTNRFGNTNQAYLFGGTAYISAPFNSALFSNDFTASVWFNAYDINNSWPTLLEEVGNTAFVMAIAGQTSGAFPQNIGDLSAFATHAQPNKDWELLPLFKPSLNKYYQAVVVRAGTNVMMYWNGTLGATNQVVNPTVEPGNTFYIGCSGDNLSSDYVFHGVIDDVRLYNRALPSNEVAQLYAYESALQLTDGLVAYYPFNGNANDASGNGNNGRLFGNTALATDRFGLSSSAFWFDGAVSSITVTNALFNIGQEGYTVSGWFCSDDVAEIDQTIFNTVPHTGIVVDLNNSNRPRRLMHGVGPVTAFWTVIYAQGTKTDYSNLTWYHLAFVKSNTTYAVYVNGQVDAQQTVAAASGYNYNVGIRIGSISDTGDFSETFKGRLDDFRIYNRALSASEVQQLYVYESAGPRVSLIKAVKPSFNNLTLTTNYQLQVSGDLNTWTNQGSAFTATNTSMVYPQYWDVDDWDELFFRLQVSP